MKEVLKHGKLINNLYKIACYNCGCEFIYSEQEIHGYCDLQKGKYVTCPECNKWNRHDFYGKKLNKRN